MRSSEIANLRVRNLVFDEPRIVARRGGGRPKINACYVDLGVFDTKTGARRTVPISRSARRMLERRIKGLKPNAYVFTHSKGKPYTKFQIPQRLESCCQRAGIVYGDKAVNKKGERIGIVFHSFRHTRTTLWIEMGYSDEVVRLATGHKSLEAYRRYARPDAGMVMYLLQENDELVAHAQEEAKDTKTG